MLACIYILLRWWYFVRTCLLLVLSFGSGRTTLVRLCVSVLGRRRLICVVYFPCGNKTPHMYVRGSAHPDTRKDRPVRRKTFCSRISNLFDFQTCTSFGAVLHPQCSKFRCYVVCILVEVRRSSMRRKRRSRCNNSLPRHPPLGPLWISLWTLLSLIHHRTR